MDEIERHVESRLVARAQAALTPSDMRTPCFLQGLFSALAAGLNSEHR
jgi:hypothetical protein